MLDCSGAVGWAGMVGIAVVTPSKSQKSLQHSTGNQASWH